MVVGINLFIFRKKKHSVGLHLFAIYNIQDNNKSASGSISCCLFSLFSLSLLSNSMNMLMLFVLLTSVQHKNIIRFCLVFNYVFDSEIVVGFDGYGDIDRLVFFFVVRLCAQNFPTI